VTHAPPLPARTVGRQELRASTHGPWVLVTVIDLGQEGSLLELIDHDFGIVAVHDVPLFTKDTAGSWDSKFHSVSSR
jgi:hypothetical protein